MKKVSEFFKSTIIVLKWTVVYFVCFGLILWFLFHFNVFSHYHWWKFFHATFHGFGGFVFVILMYSAIPIYIATALITYRKQVFVLKISVPEKIKSVLTWIKNIFITSTPEQISESKPEPIPEQDNEPINEFPNDMPRELYIPYTRAKQNIPLTFAISTFNKQTETTSNTNAPTQQNASIPIPSDFDISDSLPDMTPTTPGFDDNGFPIFKDIDFDTPITQTSNELSNNTTKYFNEHHTEYETYHEFVATEKYLIYEHNDNDFWVMDDDNWFAQKKQHKSPIAELLDLAHQNNLTPVLYLESQNIMDLPDTIKRFESMGIRVIKNLDEL